MQKLKWRCRSMIETERKEKMNELMNKISLSLKDANLQQGFEIICKRIAELEKENEGLKAFESHCDEIEEDAKAIAEENAELKEKLDKIRKYLVYDIFDRFKYLENQLKISQETQEELSKRILEQQKTIGSLTDTIDELKAHCTAVYEVNEKMKCCGNCCFAIHSRLDGTFCERKAEYRQANEKCNKWEWIYD